MDHIRFIFISRKHFLNFARSEYQIWGSGELMQLTPSRHLPKNPNVSPLT